MKEIFVFGNVEKDFERLNISSIVTYKGEMCYNNCEIHELDKEDFEKLYNEEDIVDTWLDGGWRYFEGSNLGEAKDIVKINDKEIIGWNKQYKEYVYDNLLDYINTGIGATTVNNVCAILTDLAKYNNIKISDLLANYQ